MTDAAHNQHSENRRPSDRDRIVPTGPSSSPPVQKCCAEMMSVSRSATACPQFTAISQVAISDARPPKIETAVLKPSALGRPRDWSILRNGFVRLRRYVSRSPIRGARLGRADSGRSDNHNPLPEQAKLIGDLGNPARVDPLVRSLFRPKS